MVFEVDNTTEQLINQLQESIQATIYALEDGQREIKDLIEDVKQSSASLATSAQADLMSEDVSKVKVAMSFSWASHAAESQQLSTALSGKEYFLAVVFLLLGRLLRSLLTRIPNMKPLP